MFRIPFIPREEKFFDLFEDSASNIVKAAIVLKDLVDLVWLMFPMYLQRLQLQL